MKKVISWPLGITLVYVFFVTALIAWLLFSFTQDVNLVTDDYYEQELKYQDQIDRIQRTRALSHQLTWQYDKMTKNVTLHLHQDADPQQISGRLIFFRPSDAGHDKQVAINLNAEGMQSVNAANLLPGLWRLKIFWNRNQEEYYSEGILVIE